MSEDEADYAIDSADAGASDTIPMEAGQIKKGGEYAELACLRVHYTVVYVKAFWPRKMDCLMLVVGSAKLLR